ncbi:hypothetical protein D3C87_1136210 [compost metagenome]
MILSACGQSLPNLGMGQVSVARGQAVLMVKPQVIAGGYKAQALVENYKKSDINHLVIKVFELQGGVEVPVVDDEGNHVQVDLLNSELDVPVKFSNLFRDTTYRIRCYAYKAPGEAPADLISTLDASSYTDVTITNDNAPTVTPLRVRLADVVFNGEFTSGVDVTDGGFVRGGPVTVTKQTPVPTPTPDNQPVRTATFQIGHAWGHLEIVSISHDATPGTYELSIFPDPGNYGITLGETYLHVPNWIHGAEFTINGPDGTGTLVVKLGGAPDPMMGSVNDYLIIN